MSEAEEENIDGLVDIEERIRETMQTAHAQLDIPLERLFRKKKLYQTICWPVVDARRVAVGNSAVLSSRRSTSSLLGRHVQSLQGVSWMC